MDTTEKTPVSQILSDKERAADILVRRQLHRHLADRVPAGELDRLAVKMTRDLNESGLLTDPAKTLGLVMHRVPGGGWTVAAGQMRSAQDTGDGPVTEETEAEAVPPAPSAAAWGERCARADRVAERLTAGCALRPEVTSINADNDLVIVVLHVDDLAQYEEWLPYLGVAPEAVRSIGYAAIAEGVLEGVPVRLVAHSVPELQAAADARQVLETVGGDDRA